MYPHERSLVKQLAGKPFVLVGVNSDDDLESIRKIVDRKNLTWRSFQNESSTGTISDEWGINSWPVVFILDAKGVIRFRGHEVNDSVIEELLSELGHDVKIEFDDPGPKPRKKRKRKQQKDQKDKTSSVGNDKGEGGDEGESVDEILQEYDENEDGKLQRSELPADAREQFDDIDANGDGAVDREELKRVVGDDDSGDEETADPPASKKQLSELDLPANIDANTKWNLEQMALRCDNIAKNEQGYFEAKFPNGHALVFVPQGSFEMGTNTLKGLDKPVHQVGLHGF